MDKPIIVLHEGLAILEEGITKAKSAFSGPVPIRFTGTEFMKYYDCVYRMCIQYPPHNYCVQLYERFKRALEESIVSLVLPSLMDKHDAPLVAELLNKWTNYKVMTKWLLGFFSHLDQQYIHIKDAQPLNHTVLHCFHDLINQQRNGHQFDLDLLRNIIRFFKEIEELGIHSYFDNFVQLLLEDILTYYSRLAPQWPTYDLYSNCISKEEERARQYLDPMTINKLMQALRRELINQNASKLMEMTLAERCDMPECQGMSLG